MCGHSDTVTMHVCVKNVMAVSHCVFMDQKVALLSVFNFSLMLTLLDTQ